MKAKTDGKLVCPRCGASKIQKRGIRRGKQQHQCQNCGEWFTEGREPKTNEKIIETKSTKEISKNSPKRITSEVELIEFCEIDTEVWEIERWVCESKEELSYGIMKTLFHVKAWLKRKTAEVADRSAIGALIQDARAFAPKYPKIKYPRYKDDGLLYEIDMADLHFGKLAWAQETGQDYDIDIAATIAREAVAELLNFVKQIPVSKILLPLGNDFFNVNGAGEATVNGT